MAEIKKNYRTLYAKHGRIWLKDDNQADSVVDFPFVSTYLSYEEALRNKFVSMKSERKPSYVPYEDFEELKIQFKKLEQKIEQIERVHPLEETKVALKDALSQLAEIRGIKEIQNYSEYRNLILLVNVKGFSAELFRKIADVEINLSRKYIDLCVEIRPIISDEISKNQTICE